MTLSLWELTFKSRLLRAKENQQKMNASTVETEAIGLKTVPSETEVLDLIGEVMADMIVLHHIHMDHEEMVMVAHHQGTTMTIMTDVDHQVGIMEHPTVAEAQEEHMGAGLLNTWDMRVMDLHALATMVSEGKKSLTGN